MTRVAGGSVVLGALDQRMMAAAAVLLGDSAALLAALPGSPTPGGPTATLLPLLIKACRGEKHADARWLVATALAGAFPTPDEHLTFSRLLELAPDHVVESTMLDAIAAQPRRGRADLEMTLVTGGVVLDVDYCARNEIHTGIQRVVRNVAPLWSAEHDVTPAAWIDEYSAMRNLAPREHARVYEHGHDPEITVEQEAAYRRRLIVPWRSVVVLPDVPNPAASAALSALAQFSGNELALIGYDMIPVTSAEKRPPSDSVEFARCLTVIKHAHRVAGISRSAAAEFAGFASALAAQGLPGPIVTEVVLTEESLAGPVKAERRPRGRPLVVCVGTQEPHKNHRTVLHAAERLWRAGLDFDLRLIGRRGWSDDVLAPVIARVKAAGWPLETVRRATDSEVQAALVEASFSVFISLHEGYGLPVAESLACGTPVITSNFGSQQEIAEHGGCLTVNPRDDDDVTAAMRTLLTDPDTCERLRAEAAARPSRTWEEYAAELWGTLVSHREVAA